MRDVVTRNNPGGPKLENALKSFFNRLMARPEMIRFRPKVSTFARQSKIALHGLTVYLHHVERLARERPVPLLKKVSAQDKYVELMSAVIKALPFDRYERSVLIHHCRTDDGLRPLHEFVDLIDTDAQLKQYHAKFCAWLHDCDGGEPTDTDNGEHSPAKSNVDQVLESCSTMIDLLDNETLLIYAPWYTKLDRLRGRVKRWRSSGKSV